MPFITKEFTPSYPPSNQSNRRSITQEEYIAEVERCRGCASSDDKTGCEGCKPTFLSRLRPTEKTHVMIRGGRKSSRYPDLGDYPADPTNRGPTAVHHGRPKNRQPDSERYTSVGDGQGQNMSAITADRLSGPNPLYYARTQAEDRHDPELLIHRLTRQISDALRKFQTNPSSQYDGFSFRVPTVPTLLVDAGMPLRAAEILTERRGGLRLLTEQRVVQTIMSSIAGSLGTYLLVVYDDSRSSFDYLGFDAPRVCLRAKNQEELGTLASVDLEFIDEEESKSISVVITPDLLADDEQAKDLFPLGRIVTAKEMLFDALTAMKDLILWVDPTDKDRVKSLAERLANRFGKKPITGSDLADAMLAESNLVEDLRATDKDIESWTSRYVYEVCAFCQSNGIERMHENFRVNMRSNVGKYDAKTHDYDFVDLLFNHGVRAFVAEHLPENAVAPRLVLTFVAKPGSDGKPEPKPELAKRPTPREVSKITTFQVPLAEVEHSNFGRQAAAKPKIKYKSLARVPYSELPSVLARLSVRSKHSGRKLQSLTRENPSMKPRRNPEIDENESAQIEAPGPAPVDTSLEQRQLNYVFDKVYPKEGKPELVPVPGKPGRVYWPVTKVRSRRGSKYRVAESLKEVDIEQARSWLVIAETGRKFESDYSEVAKRKNEAEFPKGEKPGTRDAVDRASRDRAQPEPTAAVVAQKNLPVSPESQLRSTSARRPRRERRFPTAGLPAQSNPMSIDEEIFMRHKGPFGASQSVPVSRRNSEMDFNPMSPAARAHLSAAMRKAQAKLREQGFYESDAAKAHFTQMGKAITEAWSEYAQDPGYQQYKASRPKRGKKAQQNPWFDRVYLPDTTATYSSLVPAPEQYEDSTAVYSALEPSARYSYSNPRQGSRREERGGGKRSASDFVRAQMGDYEEHHPIFEQWDGQFSTSEPFSAGFQPMNRRNPADVEVFTSRFPADCCVCKEPIARGAPRYVHPTMVGPKNGKRLAHENCGR